MVSGDELRKVMRRFSTGVTLLTTLREDGSVKAMTANSVTSISLDPPLVLVCVRHDRNTFQYIEGTGRYTINVLGREQASSAKHFANDEEQRGGLDPVEFTLTDSGSPKVEGCIAFLDCDLVGAHPHGDHTIFVGEVKDSSTEAGEPLVFYEGRFLGLDRS